nr:immunoglobulin light chain junction region [Macaca mulatta]
DYYCGIGRSSASVLF